MSTILLNQADPRWAKIKMLPSDLTIGRYGCTTTDICMLSDYYKCFKTPDQVVGINIIYNSQGKILWNKIDFPNFKFVWRNYQFDPVAIDSSISDEAKSVILAINFDSHWVVALRKLPLGMYLVGDPLGGKKRIISQKIISGSAHFVRK